MRRMVRWLTLWSLGILPATGCSDALGIEDILGTWETTSIDGYSVPGNVVIEGENYDIQYYRWTFIDGGLCSLEEQVNGEEEAYDDCEYAVNLEEETITTTIDGWWDHQGSIDGDKMTLSDPGGIVFVLRRQ